MTPRARLRAAGFASGDGCAPVAARVFHVAVENLNPVVSSTKSIMPRSRLRSERTVSQSLSRLQAITLGLVVVVALGLGGYGVARVAEKQGAWADTVEVTAGFPEAHDITLGTPVRLRGVDAGQVVAVEYPDHDGPGAEVTVRMKLQAKYANRIYADASAQIHGTGMLGSKVIAIQPGDPKKGAPADGRPPRGQAVPDRGSDRRGSRSGERSKGHRGRGETPRQRDPRNGVRRESLLEGRGGEQRHPRETDPRRRFVRGGTRHTVRSSQARRAGR